MNLRSPSRPQDTHLQPTPPAPKKKGLSKGCVTAIVATIIVIALLGVLGLFGGRILIKKARPLQAKAAMKGVEIAIKGYKTEYLRLPFVGMAAPSADTTYSSAEADGIALLDIMIGTTPNSNPRMIHFWEPSPPSVSGSGYSPGIGLIDAWGKKDYKIILDYDNNGHITDPEGILGPIKADVLLYSAGPDGDFATWKDNVCSWK